MRNIMRKLFIGFYVFLLCIGQNAINVKAIEGETTDFEVSLEIDESVGELTGLFDEIGRFSKDGIAKITKIHSTEMVENEFGELVEQVNKKYGLINIQGDVVLEPIYDFINDFDEVYFSIGMRTYYTNLGQYQVEGLVSKMTGKIVLEPKYTWIPSFSDEKMLNLGYIKNTQDGETITSEWKSEVISNKNGNLTLVTVPTGINVVDYDYYYPNLYKDLLYMNAVNSDCTTNNVCKYNQKMWFIDEYGNSISDISFDYVNGSTKINESHFVAFQNEVESNPKTWNAGLLEVKSIDGVTTIEAIFSVEDGYSNFWINEKENRAYYNKIVNSDNTWGYYDLVSKELVTQSQQYANIQPLSLPGFTGLTGSRTCTGGPNTIWTCKLSFTYLDDPIITDIEYDNFNIVNNKYIYLNDWNDGKNKSNIIYLNSNNEYRLLLENAVEGYFQQTSSDFIVMNKYTENQNYLTLIGTHGIEPNVIVNNSKSAWFNNVNKLLIVSQRVDETSTVEKKTIVNIDNGSVLKTDLYNLNIRNIPNTDIYYGIYSENSTSKTKPFIIKNNVFIALDFYAYSISDFDQNDIATIYSEIEFTCNGSQFNETTNQYETIEKVCTNQTFSLMNTEGEILIKDYNQIKYYNDKKAAILTKYVFDSNGLVIGNTYSFVYINKSVENKPILTIYPNLKNVIIDQSTNIATLVDNESKYKFVENGLLLDDVNNQILNANQVGAFIDGILLINEKNIDETYTIYAIDINGNKTEVVGVDSFKGRIVSKDSIYSFVKGTYLNSVLEITLVPIEGLKVDGFSEFEHLANNVYTHKNTNTGNFVFNIKFETIDNTEKLVTTYSNTAGVDNQYCEITKFVDLPIYFNVYKYTDGGCDHLNRGLMNLNGEITLNPEFNNLYVQNNYIIGSKMISGKNKQTIFDFNGVNQFGNLANIYYDNFSFCLSNFMIAYESGTPNLFIIKEGFVDFIGNYYIQEIEESGLYKYYTLNDSNIDKAGIINKLGEIIINIDKGNIWFDVDESNQLIVANKVVEGVASPTGMYDFSGNQLLSEEYSPQFTYDSISKTNSIKIDNRGFVEVIYHNPYIFNAYYENVYENNVVVRQEWKSNNNLYGIRNFFDLKTKTLLYETPILENEVTTEDGFVYVNKLTKSIYTIDEAYANYNYFYYFNNGDTEYLLEKTVELYNPSRESILDNGKYNFIDWDSKRDLVVTRKNTCVREENNVLDCDEKYGLINKTGETILEPIYESVFFDSKMNLYRTYIVENNKDKIGYINEDGILLAQGEYRYGYYFDKDFNWLLLFGRKEVFDSKNGLSGYVDVTDVVDLNTNKLIFNDLLYFFGESLDNLKDFGYQTVGIAQNSGTITERWQIDEETQELVQRNSVNPDSKNGIINPSGEYILQPIYDSLQNISYESATGGNSGKTLNGYYKLGLKGESRVCQYVRHDDVISENSLQKYECSNDKIGIFSIEKGMVLEPNYAMISSISEQGYSVVRVVDKFVEKVQQVKLDNGEFLNFNIAYFTHKTGLINTINGEVIVEPNYEMVIGNYEGRQANSLEVPLFDSNGLIKLQNSYDLSSDIGSNVQFNYGLANRQGVVLDALYSKVYYKNGEYYAHNLDGTWEIYNALDMNDKLIVNVVKEDAYIESIERLDNKKIITEMIVSNGVEEYSEFGVLNEDMSEFLPFEFTSITYDGSLWYLEKYNPILGSYPRAVMDNDGNYVVPFSDKYDSLSEFVGGFAIGQSGTKEVTDPTSSIEMPSLLSVFFLDVNAKEDDFVLEVIDENGRVVGDLSNLYESATLLGEVDGVVKALVQKDGKFYIANLVKTPINVIKITGIEVSQTQINMIEGEKFQLSGTILPANHTENKSVVWSSSDENVVVVDSNGMLKAVSAGTAVISYKVNTFQVFASVNVKKNQNPVVETPNAEIQKLKDNFVNVIKNDKSELDEFIEYYELLKAGDKDFMKYLSDEEKMIFENKIVKYFGDYIHIDYVGDIRPQSLSGLILNLDLDKLFRKENINLSINVKRVEITSEFEEYIKNNRFNPENGYLFEISIEDSEGNLMTEFDTPIRFTLSLPEDLRGKGELLILHNHNGLIEEIDTMLGIDYTFSFTLDKLSTFMLVKSERLTTVSEDVSNQSNGLGWINYLLGIVGMLVIFGIGFILLRKKVQSI